MSDDWRADVLKFWFGLDPKQWWSGGEDLDHRIKQDFIKLWIEKRQLPVSQFLADPLSALAGVILFDQFPRNMFRGNADQFATDPLALSLAKRSIEKGFDEELPVAERKFLYMPLIHSEELEDQNRAICSSLRSPTTSRSNMPRSIATSSRALAASRIAMQCSGVRRELRRSRRARLCPGD